MNKLIASLCVSTASAYRHHHAQPETLAQVEFTKGADGTIDGCSVLSADIAEIGYTLGITDGNSYGSCLNDILAANGNLTNIDPNRKLNDINIYTMLKHISNQKFAIMDRFDNLVNVAIPGVKNEI
jgi:hypothetical protein